MKFKRRNSEALADLICGNVGSDAPTFGVEPKYFLYRSSMHITEFFRDMDTDYEHDGSTRHRWVADVIDTMLNEPHEGAAHPPEVFCRLIDHMMTPADAMNEGADRPNALRLLNEVLTREGFEAFDGDDRHCYLRHIGSNTVTVLQANPHRPLSAAEQKRRDQLEAYLDICTEDELIEEVLLPLFRQLGFHRVTAVGHKDKGTRIWQGRVDRVRAADRAPSLLRYPSEEGEARRVRRHQNRQRQHRRDPQSGVDDARA